MQEILKFFDIYLKREREVASWVALQMALSGVIESLVLVDRFLYLEERYNSNHTFKDKADSEEAESKPSESQTRIVAELRRVFDPCVSPRNMAFVAHKTAH